MVAISMQQPNDESNLAKKVTLQILSDITAAQAAHGLKHSDHLRYRRYCTRRLSRIRATTKSSSKDSSHRYNSKPLSPEHILDNPRALCIPLVLSERNWAFAMDRKRDQPAGPFRARKVVIAKLGRAVKHAEELSDLCRKVADEHTVLEAEAYSKSMAAALALEREQWGVALRAYEIVHKIYTGMAGVRAGTSGATLFEKRLEEIDQGIRFCKYNISRSAGDEDELLLQELRTDAASSDVLSEKIEAALSEARRKAAVSLGEISWCGIVVPLRAERVREAVLTANEESRTFDGSAIEAYDKLFMVYNDALKVITDELADFRASSTAVDDRIKELEYLVAYISYNRLQHTVSRNLLLVSSFKNKRSSKPDDFVRLYDNLISNITDVLALKGVDEDAAVSNEAESRKKLFHAYRCFHLAQCYQAAQMQSEAAALFDRVSFHASTLRGEYGTEAAKIVSESVGMKARARAEAFLKEHELANGLDNLTLTNGGVADAKKQRMIDHLDSFESFAPCAENRRVICEMPPPLEAVPCKPVFFDLAVDGLRFPDPENEEKLQPPKPDEHSEGEDRTSYMSTTRFGRWWSGKS